MQYQNKPLITTVSSACLQPSNSVVKTTKLFYSDVHVMSILMVYSMRGPTAHRRWVMDLLSYVATHTLPETFFLI